MWKKVLSSAAGGLADISDSTNAQICTRDEDWVQALERFTNNFV